MYLQIMEQIKCKVLAGDWPTGHPLPSIRELSADTRVSVITVKRAYTELETEGVIVTQAGRGSFVTGATDSGSDLRQQEIKKHLDALLLATTGMGDDEVLELITQALANRGR